MDFFHTTKRQNSRSITTGGDISIRSRAETSRRLDLRPTWTSFFHDVAKYYCTFEMGNVLPALKTPFPSQSKVSILKRSPIEGFTLGRKT